MLAGSFGSAAGNFAHVAGIFRNLAGSFRNVAGIFRNVAGLFRNVAGTFGNVAENKITSRNFTLSISAWTETLSIGQGCSLLELMSSQL